MENQEKKPLMSNYNERKKFHRNRNSSSSSGDNSHSEGDDNWSDDYSGSYSDSDSSVPEWDTCVKDNGELVYIVCNVKKDNKVNETPSVSGNNLEPNPNTRIQRGNFTRQSVRRSSRGKILKLLRRRNSIKGKKSKNGNPHDSQVSKSNASSENNIVPGKVTFTESENGEIKEVIMNVNFANRMKYGRKMSKMEALFGISVTTFDDGKRLMVSGILPDSQAINHRQIKIGDWLKKIDNESITAFNIDTVLNCYPENMITVKLVLQRVGAKEISPNSLSNKIQQLDTVGYLTDNTNEHEVVLSQILRDLPVAIVYLTTEGLSDSGPENDGVLYCYPRPEKHNFLFTSRGTFVTLNHLIPEISKQSKPLLSTVYAKECYVNIAYTSRGQDLMLLALPDAKCNSFEIKYISEELVRVLEFTYKSLGECFKNQDNIAKLDHMFSRLFSQILSCSYSWDSQLAVRIEKIRQLSENKSTPIFEQCLPLVQVLDIPWEAHLQIDDALTELEAADYREFNDDPFNCQRLFVMIGSCLYYAGHLLASHLQDSDLLDVHSFLRLHGFLSLSKDEDIQNLVVWKEIFVSSCNRGNQTDGNETDKLSNGDSNVYKIPFGRWFIVIIGKGKFLLVTLLEAGISTVKAEGVIFPEPFYVEECESCLDLLIDVGLDKFLHQWILCNARPQVVNVPEQLLPVSKLSLAAAFTKKAPSPIQKKSPEIHSILKRAHHSSDQINANSLSISGNEDSSSSHCNFGNQWNKPNTGHAFSMNHLDLTYSDESGSQKSNSEIFEERIEGRRVLRERENRQSKNSLSSDSDGEWDGEANSQYSGRYDMSDLSQSLLEKMDLVLPTKIAAGAQNVCLHFVRLDCERGVLMAPSIHVQTQSDSELYKYILVQFRKASQKIHTLLQNTMKFKKMLSPSSSVNKSLVAIKEHGILFNVPAQYFTTSSSSKKSSESFTYWVVGRLFENHQSSEVYICYHDSVPQNIVEIAFRLGLNY